MTVALAAEDRLDEDERAQIGELSTKLHRHQYSNANKFQYYDGEIGVDNIGIAIPQSMVNVKAVLAWPEIVGDALDERIEWLGWSASWSIGSSGPTSVPCSTWRSTTRSSRGWVSSR